MRSKIEKILSTKFMKRSKTIFLGTLFSQLITFLTSFIITRYYTPEDMGLLGTLTAIISIVAGTLMFRLDIAIIQASKERSFEIFAKATILSAFISLSFCSFSILLPYEWAQKVSEHYIAVVLWTWGYFLFFNSKQIPFKHDELSTAAWAQIWRSIYAFLTQLFGGILFPSFGVLLTSRVSSDYFASLIHLKNHVKDFKFSYLTDKWKSFLKEHKDYFSFMTGQHLCSSLSQNLIILSVEWRFGLFPAGIFALSQRLIQAPLELVGSTLVSLSIQRYGELRQDFEDLRQFYIKLVGLTFVMSIILGIGIYFTIDWFVPILGSKWSSTSTFIKFLVPYFMALLIQGPAANILRMTNQSNLQFIFEFLEAVCKAIILFAISYNSAEEMILQYGILSIGFSISKTFIVLKVMKPISL